MANLDDDELLDALGIDAAPIKVASLTPREERIIAGFEDILRFYQAHGRPPQHGEDRDIFERIYAVRLDQLRKLPESPALLGELDEPGLLSGLAPSLEVDDLDPDELLAELGVDAAPAEDDIRVLKHVRTAAEIKAAEQIANRAPCQDFDRFAGLFSEAKEGIKNGTWTTKPFAKDASIEVGDFYIVGGQIAYVADMEAEVAGSVSTTKDGRFNPRLRVIFDNHTEADLLLRSLSRSLYPDGDTPVGRRLIKIDAGPLFSATPDEEDIASGTIYVLRSHSDNPYVKEHRDLIHKIGVTGGKVEARIAGAAKDATYLLADVEVVATYQLHNINRARLEHIFHRLFAAAQLDLTIEDRFGTPVKPKEWFLVPLQIIDDAVQRIVNGSITDYVYDPQSVELKKVD